MSTRRLSTVHDLASLRLHPDGTRVQNSEKNLRIRASKYAAQDTKGNWFARDAGGTGNVKQRWAKPRDEDADEESSSTDEDELPAKNKGKQRATEDNEEEQLKDNRARKRRRFYEDESFIAATPSGGPSAQGSPKASSSRLSESEPPADWVLPTPSAETLKCMHYFACNYYTAMGQLRDSTKGARRSKKARRRKRLQEEEDGARSSEPPDEPAPHESSTEEESSSASESEDDEDEDANGGNYKPQMRSRRQRRASPDMYKAFDGSALMAISMFVQEHIAQLLSADVPDEWDAEMEADRQAQRGKQAALNSLLESQHGRPSWKVRSRKAKDVGDEEVAEEPDKDKDIETPGRRTRGVVLPKVSVPFLDDSSEDEDYVP